MGAGRMLVSSDAFANIARPWWTPFASTYSTMRIVLAGWPRYGMSRPGSTWMLSGEGSSADVAYSQVPAGTVAMDGTVGTG
jgi:hypothetical protein